MKPYLGGGGLLRKKECFTLWIQEIISNQTAKACHRTYLKHSPANTINSIDELSPADGLCLAPIELHKSTFNSGRQGQVVL